MIESTLRRGIPSFDFMVVGETCSLERQFSGWYRIDFTLKNFNQEGCMKDKQHLELGK